MTASTIQRIIKKNENQLKRIDLEIILANGIHKSREFVVAHPEFMIEDNICKKINEDISKRKEGYPLAYIIGKKEFFGLSFDVNESVLIPRPETEQMVELILKEIDQLSLDKKILLMDIGTGSGCIPISVAKNCKNKNSIIIASDISKEALATAKSNASKHDVEIDFIQGNLIEPLYEKVKKEYGKIVISANLPYITEDQYINEPTIKFEPKNALVAGNDGLALYSELLLQIKSHIPYANIPVSIYLEIDPSQTKKIGRLISSILKKNKISIYKDICGRDRIVKIKI